MHATARAYAKINLGLKIVARRGDGFHELRTVFQTISLADSLEISSGRGRGVTLTTTGLPTPSGQANLAVRAATLAADRFAIPGRIEIRLDKQIPLGAGLGGGSSDAAAVLRMMAHAARRPPALCDLLALARELGSDVPLFLLGGTVLGLGRGDEVYALPDLAPWHCVLAMPRSASTAGLATPAAFADWDRRHRAQLTEKVRSSTLMEFCSLVDQVLPAFRTLRNRGSQEPKVHAGIENDFLPGVFSLSPDFPRIHHQLCRTSAAWIGLTGSGAAQFGLFSRAEPAKAVATALARRHCTWRARFVPRHVVQRSVQFES